MGGKSGVLCVDQGQLAVSSGAPPLARISSARIEVRRNLVDLYRRSCYGSVFVKIATEEDPISLDELRCLAAGRFGDLVKAVIDLERRIMIVDADLHADQEAELLAGGSQQQDLWGINFYPDLPEDDWLEFDSMINLRPSFGNRSRGVDDPTTRERIAALVRRMVRR